MQDKNFKIPKVDPEKLKEELDKLKERLNPKPPKKPKTTKERLADLELRVSRLEARGRMMK